MKKFLLVLSIILCVCAQMDQSQIDAILKKHNDARARYCLAPLTWNTAASQVAQAYSNKCVFQHNTNRGNYGENIAYRSSSSAYPEVSTLADGWLAEESKFTCGGGFSSATGHWTQIMWEKTTSVGCGLSKCDSLGGGMKTYYLVCNYDPPGNYGGQTAYKCPKGNCGNTPTPTPPAPVPPPTTPVPTPVTPTPVTPVPTPVTPTPVPSTNGTDEFEKIIEFYWTSRGAKRGSCKQITEPEEPFSWDDNYLCALDANIDSWIWTHNGTEGIANATAYNWIQWQEPSDPYGWDNNFLGVPIEDKRKYAFSYKARIPSMTCTRTRESRSRGWSDNWWCTAASTNAVVNVGVNGVYNGPEDEDSTLLTSSASVFAHSFFALAAVVALLF